MTGRELILYILENGLENEPVIKDGKFIGFKTVSEVAASMDVGVATVNALISMGRLKGVTVRPGTYIPANYKHSISNV